MVAAEHNRKRGSEQSAGHVALSGKNQMTTESNVLALPPPMVPPSPNSVQDPKRTKTTNESEKNKARPKLKLAGPLDGCRRGQ